MSTTPQQATHEVDRRAGDKGGVSAEPPQHPAGKADAACSRHADRHERSRRTRTRSQHRARQVTTVLVALVAGPAALGAAAAQPGHTTNRICDHTVMAGGHVMAWVASCSPPERSSHT